MSIFDLRHLVEPVSANVFINEYWERRPLVVAGRGESHYQGLLSLADVDRVLSGEDLRSSTIQLVRDGSDIPLSTLRANGRATSSSLLEALYEEYRAGATIVLPFLHETQKPLMRLCRTLAEQFSAAFHVNAYLTPPNSQGFSTHYDTHDVFVLQTEGSKHWRIFQAPLKLPLRGQPFRRGTMESGVLEEEVELNPGDLIYIPRGVMHDATTGHSTSLHLTVGVTTVTWASVILGAVEACIEQEPRFRASLPPGFATDESLQEQSVRRFEELIELLGTQADPRSAIADAIERALRGLDAERDGRLLDLESQIGVDTRLRRRPGVHCRLASDGDSVDLRFNGKSVRMPARVEPALRFLTQADEFTPSALPGNIDEPGTLVLVRRLVQEGLLTISR